MLTINKSFSKVVHITITANKLELIQNSNIQDLFLKRLNGFQQNAPSQISEKVLHLPVTHKVKILFFKA